MTALAWLRGRGQVQPDDQALKTFSKLGLRLFWLRQIMFIGATAISSLYLASYIPIFCYLFCLASELSEAAMSRRTLSIKTLNHDQITRITRVQTAIGVWSAFAVSCYALLVAWLGTPEFLFVPLTYLISAALYASIFNHQVKPLLTARLVVYTPGFVIMAGMGLFMDKTDTEFLPLAQLVTILSAVLFIVINAVVTRENYEARRSRERDVIAREALLREEVETRKSAETVRQSSEQRFHSLFEYAPIPIREEDLSGMKRLIDALDIQDTAELEVYLDAHPEFLQACAKEIAVVDANRASLAEHGYRDKSEFLARVVTELTPAAYKIVRMTILALHEGAEGRSYETRITRADGKIRTVAATWRVLPGHEDTYRRILLCSVDLSDRLAAEDALRQAQKMEAVGQLTGGVAHDFNNLLTVIRGNVELLELMVDVDPEFSTPIINAVDRGAELTQRLLAFSRKQPLAVRTFDLGDMVLGMGNMLRRTLGMKNTIEIDVPDDLWPVMADPAQVEAALLNFALNSRDAMLGGGVLNVSCRNAPITTENDLDLGAGDYVALRVEDTGTGMDPDTLSRVYEPFFTTKEVGKGSGLGLSMAYGFAKQSGGAVDIQSTLGQGTQITLYLPRSDHSPENQASAPVVDPKVKAQGETILVLEDNEGIRSYVTQLLRKFGYSVLEASTVEAARMFLPRASEIDLLISDILLPGGLIGPDFAVELRRVNPDVPVIFMSGQPSEIETAASGVFHDAPVLSKPFAKTALLDRVSKALEN